MVMVLVNKDTFLDDDLSNILKLSDDLYNDEEGQKMFEALESFANFSKNYPNVGASGLAVSEAIMSSVLAPLTRLEGTKQARQYVTAMNKVLVSRLPDISRRNVIQWKAMKDAMEKTARIDSPSDVSSQMEDDSKSLWSGGKSGQLNFRRRMKREKSKHHSKKRHKHRRSHKKMKKIDHEIKKYMKKHRHTPRDKQSQSSDSDESQNSDASVYEPHYTVAHVTHNSDTHKRDKHNRAAFIRFTLPRVRKTYAVQTPSTEYQYMDDYDAQTQVTNSPEKPLHAIQLPIKRTRITRPHITRTYSTHRRLNQERVSEITTPKTIGNSERFKYNITRRKLQTQKVLNSNPISLTLNKLRTNSKTIVSYSSKSSEYKSTKSLTSSPGVSILSRSDNERSILHQILADTSYSDEEKDLKTNLYNAFDKME